MYTASSEDSRLISSGWKEWLKAAPMYTAFSEESRLISSGLEGVVDGSVNVHCVLERESANLIGLHEAVKVICNEQDAHYEEMGRANHCNTESSEVGEVGLGAEGFLEDPVAGVTKSFL